MAAYIRHRHHNDVERDQYLLSEPLCKGGNMAQQNFITNLYFILPFLPRRYACKARRPDGPVRGGARNSLRAAWFFPILHHFLSIINVGIKCARKAPERAAPYPARPREKYYRIMQISPEQPSLITRSMVSCRRVRASEGICGSLFCSPSLTNFMQALAEDIALPYLCPGPPRNPASRLLTSSSDWRSLPTMGATSVGYLGPYHIDGRRAGPQAYAPYRPP